MRPGAPRARFPGRWAGTRRKGRDDETTRRPRAGGEIRRGRGTGRSRAGGWTSTTPRRGRGARAQAGRGRPGAWGGRRDSGLWLARRSPARASVAGSPSGRQERKRWPILARASGLPCPPSSRSGTKPTAARPRAGAAPLRRLAALVSTAWQGRSLDGLACERTLHFTARRHPASGSRTRFERARHRVESGRRGSCQELSVACGSPGAAGEAPGSRSGRPRHGRRGSRRPTSSVAFAGPFGGPSGSERSALAE